ncbi:MAG: hypothetical protein K0R24_2236 [Gammaproteobacteria bacterium]|jgi:hypothetical protein|nr:hypothetical protein [Gammaproteobacteria bacterium]
MLRNLTITSEFVSTFIPTAGFLLHCFGCIGTTTAVIVLPYLIPLSLAALSIGKFFHSAMLCNNIVENREIESTALAKQECIMGVLLLTASSSFLFPTAIKTGITTTATAFGLTTVGLVPMIAVACLGFAMNATHNIYREYHLYQKAIHGGMEIDWMPEAQREEYTRDRKRCMIGAIISMLGWLTLAAGSVITTAPFFHGLLFITTGAFSFSNLWRNVPTFFCTRRNNRIDENIPLDVMGYRSTLQPL